MPTAPRYTSYPPVPRWGQVRQQDIDAALQSISGPAQVYVHVPFCVSQCSFCGCNMVVARRRAAGTRYLKAIERYIESLTLPAQQIPVQRIHFGGGTPTWLSPDELSELMGILSKRFSPIEGAELSLEANPHVTTAAHIERLIALGFTRLSLGVQSFDEGVLSAVGRAPMREKVIALLDQARAAGLSMSLDLMTGLPQQTPETITQTIAQTVALKPERISIFGYAHVPWMKRHQKALDGTLPPVEMRRTLRKLARQQLLSAGYVPIGFDHFSLPHDPLAVALREGNLHRNFMGYTTMGEVDLIGVGCSAISDVAGVYWQDEPRLRRWQEGVENGTPIATRGHVLTEEEKVRRSIINALLCHLQVDTEALRQQHGIDFHEQFASSIQALSPMVNDGHVEITAEGVRVTESGRSTVRLIAQAFDAGGAGRYSSID